MRMMVTGRTGQVATALSERATTAGFEVVAIGRPEFDLADAASIRRATLSVQPDVIVSAAAYTAVDRAESERDLAFAVNAEGPAALARIARELDVPIIHLSTDYVFSGDKAAPYLETDATAPASAYGLSKLQGERSVAEIAPNHAILRTAWVYSPFGSNFLKTMLRLAGERDMIRVVADQRGQPSSALDIADAIFAIARRLGSHSDDSLRGIFHMTGSGEASWADFAQTIFSGLGARTGRAVRVERIGTQDYPTPAKRPANSRLSNEKLRDVYGLALPEWQGSVGIVLDRLLADTREGRA